MTRPLDDDEMPVDETDELDPEDLNEDGVDEFEDFDAYWEKNGATPTVVTARICGVDVEVPTDLPLEVEVITNRHGGQLSDGDVERIVELIFGEDVLNQWMANGMTSRQFPVVCAWAMANGAGRRTTFAEAAEKVAEAEARPTNRADRRAASRPRGSDSGRSSSRTSRANTNSSRRR